MLAAVLSRARREKGSVADFPAAVTDTHPVIFHASGTRALGSRAAVHFRRCELQQAILYVPAAAIWETCILARASRISLRKTVRAFFDDLFSNPAYQPLELTPEQIFDADDLRFTRDPFDVLICAAARSLQLPLVTRDGAIGESGVVRVLW